MSMGTNAKLTELQVGGGAVVVGGLAYILDSFAEDGSPIDAITTPLMWLAGVVLLGVVVHNRWYFSRKQRWRRELGGPDGWLDRHGYRDHCSPKALREHGTDLRPGMTITRSTPISELGWCAGRLVTGSHNMRRKSVYSPWSRGVVIFGPQGSGKSQYAVHIILDAPGPVLASSTKLELAGLTSKIRAARGHTHLLNPQKLGDQPGTVQWSPIDGCDDPDVAEKTAAALVRGGGGARGTERAEFWAGKATEIIRVYLLAAALAGYDMQAVEYWAQDNAQAANPDTTPAAILERHPQIAPPAWIGTYRTNVGASWNTRTGYFATVISAVSFMNSPSVRAACTPAPGQGFSIERFLQNNETLYLVGSKDGAIAPLLTAFTERVFDTAKRLGALAGGRLPTPLTMLLDEAANITPVPLDEWAADSRGWGITVCPIFQDLSQINTTWGPTRANTVFGTLPTKIGLPGVANPDDLETLSYLGGDRDVEQVSEGEHNSGKGGWGARSRSRNISRHRERVVTGHTIYGMPKWHAYVLGLDRKPAMVTFEPGYKRVNRELKRVERGQRKASKKGPGGGNGAGPAPSAGPDMPQQQAPAAPWEAAR